MTWMEGAGQREVLSGRVMDTTTNIPCMMAVISMLKDDSTLVTSTHSDRDGRFRISGTMPRGQYILLVEHPTYVPFYRVMDIDGITAFDLGILALTPKSDTLQAVTVTPADFRPHFRKDTLEYNTANIKMNTNANVEEMIGRLPGLQVNPDGAITYNGQKIQQVLVDGHEMFGSDLTLVTRNLNADMISKVQILDTKSKQTQFTGIDDGQLIKTLNLVLKDKSKSEFFIKMGVGDGLDGYYHLGGVLGAFRGKDQLMIVGSVTNTGNTGFGGSSNTMSTNVSVSGGTNDLLGAEAGIGIPQSIGGAGHYATELGSGNIPFSLYYRGGHLITHPFSSSLTEQILPDSLYIQSQQNNSVNSQKQQALDASFAYTVDSLSAFQGRLVGGEMRGTNIFNSIGSSSFNDTLTNSSIRSLNSNVTYQHSFGDLMWRIRARGNSRRVFSILSNFSVYQNYTDGYLYSIDKFYQSNGMPQRSDTTDQRKAIFSGDAALNGSLNYTTPLWKNAIIGATYGLSIDNSHSEQFSYTKADGKYQDLVDSLSDNYRVIFLTQRASLVLQGHGKTCDYALGGNIMDYNCQENDLLNDTVLRYKFFGFSPRLAVDMHPNSSTEYTFRYSGSKQLPSIVQLQPVQNNTNPLYITLGNPNLHPSYTHTAGLEYHRIGSILFNLGLDAGITSNSISTKTYTDSLGRQISQQVNTSGSDNGALHTSISKRLKSLEIEVGIDAGFSYSRSVNYVNALLCKNDNNIVGGGIFVEKYVANIYNFRVNTNFSYSSTTSSINATNPVNYWIQNHSLQLEVFLVKNWEINTNINYTWRQKTPVFQTDNTTVLWNTGLRRNFLDNRLTLQFNVNDILGQNSGISRNISANQISQTNSNVIGRYWMLSVLYQFNHKLRSR